jgi:hypothetical protein
VARPHRHLPAATRSGGTRGLARFGPDGAIATPQACAAAHGRFFPQLFGWMVHVYPFEKTPEKIWAVE